MKKTKKWENRSVYAACKNGRWRVGWRTRVKKGWKGLKGSSERVGRRGEKKILAPRDPQGRFARLIVVPTRACVPTIMHLNDFINNRSRQPAPRQRYINIYTRARAHTHTLTHTRTHTCLHTISSLCVLYFVVTGGQEGGRPSRWLLVARDVTLYARFRVHFFPPFLFIQHSRLENLVYQHQLTDKYAMNLDFIGLSSVPRENENVFNSHWKSHGHSASCICHFTNCHPYPPQSFS